MLPGSAHATVKQFGSATLFDEALYSCPRITFQLWRHTLQCPFLNRAGAWRTPSSTDTIVEYCFLIHIEELVPNVFDMAVRQYQIRNRLTQRTRVQRRRPGVIPLPSQQITLIIFRRLFSVRYIGTFPQSVKNWYSILFEVHVHWHIHLAHLVAPTIFSTFILGRNAIFSFFRNIQLLTMNWIWNTPLTFTTYDSLSCNNSRWK